MEATKVRLAEYREVAVAKWQARQQLVQELATLSAHLNAATARWLELALEARRQGVAAGDDFGRYLAFRCGISTREAREYLRVADALEEQPAIRAAFGRGELSFCKLRALTRVATPVCEERLLGLAWRTYFRMSGDFAEEL